MEIEFSNRPGLEKPTRIEEIRIYVIHKKFWIFTFIFIKDSAEPKLQ